MTGIFLIVSQHQLMPSSYSILHYHYTLVIFLATSIITGIIQSSLLLIIFLCLHVLFCDANQFFVFLTLFFFSLKVRKLEFLLADALDKGCSHVITCGSVQSNHCRAVAVAARQIGLTPHLFLRSAAEV